MATGTVRHFNDAKGFGFIAQDVCGPDIVVHYSQLQPPGTRLVENTRVQYDLGTGSKGPQALNVITLEQ
ncbi:cold-shock protein [Streptomyces sp. NPDC101165]|uniref:cold-shock protein n=1 Tax=Streptomyces sp. NPDC101165 TaxID=3366119 RepID=UPI003820F3AE